LLECSAISKRFGAVVITHNVEVVFEIADRIVVLYVGRRVATFEQRTTTPQEVVAAIVGLEGERLAVDGGR
jgi:D-xylose transport system ATP-binding protein